MGTKGRRNIKKKKREKKQEKERQKGKLPPAS